MMQSNKRISIKTGLLVALIFLAVSNSSCQQNQTIDEQTKADKIDELVSVYEDYGQFNGSILVSENGEVVLQKGYGWANMELDVPNKPDTKYRLASVTKQFTAMLVAQLAAENKLELEAPISTYLPDYPAENGDRITVHHLLTHTSGIPNYTSFRNYREIMPKRMSPSDLVVLFADSALQFTPGNRFEYSNSGYVLLGSIMEEVTGKTYQELLQEKIFSPLKMENSGFDNWQTILKNRATGYYKNGGSYSNANYIDMSVAYAAGGIYSTVEDLFRWDQSLYSEQLVPKKFMDQIFDKHVITYGAPYYGYGWEIGEMAVDGQTENVKTMSHSGAINGFNTLITRIPFYNTSIILLSNVGGSALYDMSRSIAAILFDKPYDFPKRSVADFLSQAIKQDGMEAALDLYSEIKDSSDFYLDENEMNMVGYDLLQAGKVEEAALVFELNVAAYPTSFNVYDSYGEVLMVMGQTDKAIENYQRSVRMNPSNENGIRMLEKLGVETEE